MTKARLIVGLCMLCALAVTAVGASSASAAGTTAFTCKKSVEPNTGQFVDEHCTKESPGSKDYEHVAFANGTPTELTLTNEKTCSETTLRCTTFLHSVSSGVNLKLHAEKVHGTGTMSNSFNGGPGEHVASGSGVIIYSEIKVTEPAEKGCKVKGSEIKTNELQATTEGQEMALKFSPKEGTTFATFEIEGCSIGALNHKYEVTGSVKSTSISGATTTFTAADTTAQNTLKLSGQKAGIDGVGTFLGRDNSSEQFTPLTVTTTP